MLKLDPLVVLPRQLWYNGHREPGRTVSDGLESEAEAVCAMLFEHIGVIGEQAAYQPDRYVGVRGHTIAYIGDTPPEEDFGQRYDGREMCIRDRPRKA